MCTPTTSSSLAVVSTFTSRRTQLLRKLSPFPSVDEKTAKILWRDFIFLVLGSVALSIISYVETHAPDADARGGYGAAVRRMMMMMMNTTSLLDTNDAENSTSSSNNTTVLYSYKENPMGIVDTGFILTAQLHAMLSQNQPLTDVLACLNSIFLLIPTMYTAYITIWIGDYSLVFRVISTQLLRSFCGWFTYLPPDPSYLTSYYDFPDIAQCLFTETTCSGAPQALPFVSFFSGHVASTVIAGNHMWLRNFTKLAIFVHTLNIFQIVRLLATRGHYSIDIIIGWYVAIYVSNSAARLGRYYSRGDTSLSEIMPCNATDAFETFTGVMEIRQEARMSSLMRRKDVQDFLRTLQESDDYLDEDGNDSDCSVGSETTARIIHERLNELQEQVNERLYELQEQAQTRVEELQREFAAYRAAKLKQS